MPKCDEKLPSLCGGSRLPTLKDAPCHHVRLTGITNVTIWQDEAIDLTQGIHAYDENDAEIEFTYTPTSIDTSVPGTYVVTYQASGEGDALKLTMCGDVALHLIDCGNETVKKSRTITVLIGNAIVGDATVDTSCLICA